tara:strand:+ start:49999 stop:50349 length:351 start_codon:yes stop_codon:yes gene_type:complete
MKIFRLPCFLGLLALPLTLLAGDETGEEIYSMYCVQCHGSQSDGRGINAASMSVLPRSHIDPVEMGARQDDDLFKVIEQGGPSINKSILMPAWGNNLTSEQIDKLVQYLRSICCGE